MTGKGSPPKRKKQRLDIQIPIAALSTNKLYLGKKRRSYHYKHFRRKVFSYLDDNYDRNLYSLKGNLTFHMVVGFSSTLSDLSNSIKGIEDVLVAWVNNGFDDRQICKIILEKRYVNKGSEYMRVSICKSRKNIDDRVKKVTKRGKRGKAS